MSKYAIENVEWPDTLFYMASQSRVGAPLSGAVEMNKGSEFEIKVVPAEVFVALFDVATKMALTLKNVGLEGTDGYIQFHSELPSSEATERSEADNG